MDSGLDASHRPGMTHPIVPRRSNPKNFAVGAADSFSG